MSPIVESRLTLRSVLIHVFVVLCIIAFVAYVLFQARLLIAGPQITVWSASGSHTERQVELHGQAKNIVHMTLNGRQIYTDKEGNFKEALILENGYTIATLQAQDRYGRTIRHTETFVFTKEEDEPEIVVIN